MSVSQRTGLSLNMGAHTLGERPRPAAPAVRVSRTLAEEERYFEFKSDAEREEEWARDGELEDMRESDRGICW